VKPYDLVAMKEAQARCGFNILHVCDYHASYASYASVVDYPGHVVNCSTRMATGELPLAALAKMFQRPMMGGLDRHGVIAKGSLAEVEAEIRRVLQVAPRQFILGADCTVAGDTDWKRLRHAIDVAHRVARA
jgi:uroporphyrinogen decarboxylase